MGPSAWSAGAPAVSLDVRGITVDDASLAYLRARFAADHAVKLEAMLSVGLGERVRKRLASASFHVKVHPTGVEHCLDDGELLDELMFLFNDPTLFRTVEAMTQCPRIGSFAGRLYRMPSAEGFGDEWHRDLTEHRMIALSLNLGDRPCEGGVLELREASTKRTLRAIPNPRFGDAVLFRLHEALEHRITPVVGDEPKLAWAGWFRSQPDFYAELKRGGTLRPR